MPACCFSFLLLYRYFQRPMSYSPSDKVTAHVPSRHGSWPSSLCLCQFCILRFWIFPSDFLVSVRFGRGSVLAQFFLVSSRNEVLQNLHFNFSILLLVLPSPNGSAGELASKEMQSWLVHGQLACWSAKAHRNSTTHSD